MSRPWVILVLAGLLEIVWATALQRSEGFSRVVPASVAVGAAAVSFVLLALALRSLPVGTAYAAWTSIGVFGVAVVGIATRGDGTSVVRLLSLGLIAAGVVGLRSVEE